MMITRTHTIFIFIIILLLLTITACEKENPNSQTFQYINLEFYEDFSSGQSLGINLQTVEPFPCSNFTLIVDVEESSTGTKLKISDIEVPDICITSTAPASKSLLFEDINKTNKNFQIQVNDKNHELEFHINDSTITIEKGNIFDDYLFFAFDTIRRIPLNTVWGYIVNNDTLTTSQNDIYRALMESFFRLGAIPVKFSDGNYYYFQIKDSEIFFRNLDNNTLGFYFNYSGSILELVDTFNAIATDNQNKNMLIRIFSTNGQRYVM